MNKVYLKAYINCNLGDDIFIHMITKRYKNTKFQLITYKNYDINYNENLIVKRYNLVNRIINKLIVLSSKHTNSLENILMKKSDLTVLIGGSMFIENDSNPSPYFIGGGNPYYILGSNFGPYKTEEYYDKFFDIFNKAEDVCFRDKYSYNLFKCLNNVRMASDIVFSLDTKKYVSEIKKNVVISVIDVSKKVDEKYEHDYMQKIIDLIKLFKEQSFTITLMSFCKDEGDELAIEKIMSKITDNDGIVTYYYRGNIDEALTKIGQSSIVVGTRFHANILGLIMNKTIIPIAYSDKTINALRDINYQGKIFDIRSMNDFDISSINENDLKYKCDVSKQIVDSEKHFQKLDLIIEKDV